MFKSRPMPTFEGAPNWGTEWELARWGQHGWDLAEKLANKLTPDQLSEIAWEPEEAAREELSLMNER